MRKYIDVEVLIDDLVNNRGFYPAIVASAIKNTPTADVVEVVRCKDCKLRCTEDCPMMVWDVSGELMGDNEDNDYCSYGERREE